MIPLTKRAYAALILVTLLVVSSQIKPQNKSIKPQNKSIKHRNSQNKYKIKPICPAMASAYADELGPLLEYQVAETSPQSYRFLKPNHLQVWTRLDSPWPHDASSRMKDGSARRMFCKPVTMLVSTPLLL